MNILVANDDGIESKGISELVRALAEDHEVYVCAPDAQRSGAGHGITIINPVTVTEFPFPCATKAYAMSGTPADCVKMGLELLADDGVEIDMVFSGINNGGNLGTDTLYSGTVSAALEGAMCGLPAVAVSIDSLDPENYDLITKLARRATQMNFAEFGDVVVLNINAPDLPESEVKGVKVVGLGLREYYDWNVRSTDDNDRITLQYGRTVLRYCGERAVCDEFDADSNDVGASQCGYATITPLHFDLTNYELIEKVRTSGIAEIIDE